MSEQKDKSFPEISLLDVFATIATTVDPIPENRLRSNSNAASEDGADQNPLKPSAQSQSSVKKPGHLAVKSPRKRAVHNMCERKRRENIRDGFARLLARLPVAISSTTVEEKPRRKPSLSKENDGLTVSKMEILKNAAEHIKKLQASIRSLNTEVEGMRRKSGTPSPLSFLRVSSRTRQ